VVVVLSAETLGHRPDPAGGTEQRYLADIPEQAQYYIRLKRFGEEAECTSGTARLEVDGTSIRAAVTCGRLEYYCTFGRDMVVSSLSLSDGGARFYADRRRENPSLPAPGELVETYRAGIEYMTGGRWVPRPVKMGP